MAPPLEHLIIEISEHGIARVIIDRPPANAFNMEVLRDIRRAATYLNGEDRCRVVLLESVLGSVFVAGADLDMLNENWEKFAANLPDFQETMNCWEQVRCPTIAVINGHALGAGCEIALACDFRLMARGRPRIGLPEARRGLLPAAGGTQRLGRLIGRARALNLCLRGAMIGADEAEQIGLVSQALDATELGDVANSLAEELSELPPMTLAAIKRCLLAGLDTDLQSGLAIEQREMLDIGQTEDAREGVLSFLEKRDPHYVGR